MEQYQKSINLHFIPTQRLSETMPTKGTYLEKIKKYSLEIKDKISTINTESAFVSQSKNETFPERLFLIEHDEFLSEENLRAKYENLKQDIQYLESIGLTNKEDSITLPKRKLNETEQRALSLYIKDRNEEISIFDDLKKRIKTFLDIVAPKLRNKKFKIDNNHGFVFEAIQDNNKTLKPTQLSSGEQHQIVLFYELIFKSNKHSFLLIDEPEISLHVDWQRQFVDDIFKVAQLGDHYFLIATHSPQIIGSYRKLAIGLEGGILND